MRRDPDLIRLLMIDLENAKARVFDHHSVDGYSRDEVAYHLAMIVQAKFAVGDVRYPNTGSDPTIPNAVMVIRLTPAGHDWIETLRDETVWAKVKARSAKVAAGVSLEVLKHLGDTVATQLLGLP